MSTRTGFAIVGTAIGAYFGNASLGYAIGSMVGGYVDPVQVKGPRISDAQQQTSQDGVPIPITYGAVRISGNIIASGKLVEHRKVDDGKGSGTETTTYYYTRTYAIGICEGPVGAIRRIWRDGKLVFDQSPASLDNYSSRASTRQFLSKSDIYLGDELQEPNSALQALYGAENVPAHRGLAYIVVRDDDLTNRAGSIPSYEFEVVQEATPSSVGEFIAPVLPEPRWFYMGAPGRTDPRSPVVQYRYGIRYFSSSVTTWYDSVAEALQIVGRGKDLVGWTHSFILEGENGRGANLPIAPYETLPEPQNDDTASLGLVYAVDSYAGKIPYLDISGLTPELVNGGIYIAHLQSGAVKYGSGVVSNTPLEHSSSTPIRVAGETYYFSPDIIIRCQPLVSCELYPDPSWVEIPGTPGFYVDQAGNVHEVGQCETVAGSFKQLQLLEYQDSSELYYEAIPLGPIVEVGSPFDTQAFWEAAYQQARLAGKMPSGLIYNTDYPKSTTTACYCASATTLDPTYPILSQVVADLCFRKGLTGEDVDVAQLTDQVKGFTVATATSAADAINALAPAYMFDMAEWDGRLRAVKRGAPTIAALNEDDAFDSDNGRIIETRAQELELPRKMTVSYMDVDANYAVTTQSASRLSATVASTGTDQVQLTVVMDSDKAAQVADILLKDQWASINGTLELKVSDAYSDIVPTDVLFLSYEDALFRARAVEVDNSEGVVSLKLQQDIAGAYSSIAKGVPPRPAEEGIPTVIGPTFVEVLNLPALRDQDDRVGVYVAAGSPLAPWPGCQIAISLDGGQSWTDVLQITQMATLGYLTESLPSWSEHIVDPIHKMHVGLTCGDFESITSAQVYEGSNAICIGDEIVQYQTALLTTEKDYQLGGVTTRGRKNTLPASWPINSRVVSLDSVYFIPLDRSAIGKSITLRATSLGTDVQYGTVKSIDLSIPRSVQEWKVTNIVSSRASDLSLSVQWSPRHRLGTSRNPYPSQAFNGYRLVFSNGTVSKTFDTTAQEFIYSASQQASDFGSAGALSLTIYAMNSIIGPGEGVTVNV